ncbi:MAG TPA: OmpW family outer membrane protein [Allosphingosinicella sp.]|uniref:OmpW/AlkL family protein n=1 Tax=Allosphingosinicella sp. TaxID=2823234 RepID=UPI002ED8E53D
MRTGALSNTAIAAAALIGLASPAVAQDGSDWFVHIGPAQLTLADGADVRAGGAPLAGAGIDTDPQYTGVVEIGRFVAPNVAVALTLGGPPLAKIDGTGTLEGLGRLGNVRYGPGALTVQFHPMRSGRVQPYVGAGVTYMHIFSTKDAALSDIEVNDDIGPLIQGGVQYFFSEKTGIFVDVKKGWLRTEATASLGTVPIDADLKLDPLVVNAGLAFRF